MGHFIKYFLSLFITISMCLGGTGYNTIYLMEFDNLNNDFTHDHMKEALPNLVRENYKFREDIIVEYAGSITPYIEKYKDSDADSIKGLIISGSFQTVNDEFYIEYEAYDIHDWRQLTNRQLSCPLHDIICVHDNFLISVERNISPFLHDELDLEATINSLKQRKRKNIPTRARSLDNDTWFEKDTTNDNMRGFDLQVEELQDDQGQYGDRHFREFDIKKLLPQQFFKNKEYSEKFNEIIGWLLDNPYDVNIGDLHVALDPHDSDILSAELSVKYHMKDLLLQEGFEDLPYERYLIEENHVIIEFSSNDFMFDEMWMKKIAYMQSQVMPVIFFNDQIGRPQFIILDSWSNKYESLKTYGISMVLENQFKPLFSLTSGISGIQLILNTGTLEALYRFTIPVVSMGDYTKVTVKFMQESELEKLLESSYGGG